MCKVHIAMIKAYTNLWINMTIKQMWSDIAANIYYYNSTGSTDYVRVP